MSQSTPLQRVTVLGALQKQNFQGNATRAGVERGCRDLVAWWGSSFGSFRGITDANTGEARSKLTGDDDLHAGFALGGGVKVRPGTRAGWEWILPGAPCGWGCSKTSSRMGSS